MIGHESDAGTSPSLPESPPYDLLITIVSAEHIPVGDVHGKSDGYIIAKVKNVKGLLNEYPTNPETSSESQTPSSSSPSSSASPASRIHFRTSTKRNTRHPDWNESWRIGGVRRGSYVKLKLYDEDPRKRLDDKLGSIKYVIDGDLQRFTKQPGGLILDLPTRNYKGAKHIQLLTHAHDLFHSSKSKFKSIVRISLKLLPPTHPSRNDIHLINPTRFSVHISPLINLVASAPQHSSSSSSSQPSSSSRRNIRSNGNGATFKSYRISLIHPPPSEPLRFSADASHAKSFDPSKLRYRLTHHFIRKQYQNIYGYNSRTVYGSWWENHNANHHPEHTNNNNEEGEGEGESVGLGRGLVELLQPNIESKIFTFVITREGEWRFCETGEEYKVNKLSKHSMHADGKDTVAWGGEFFIRRTESLPDEIISGSTNFLRDHNKGEDAGESSRGSESGMGKGKGVHEWTIILDNDSGTYSPPDDKRKLFEEFMTSNLKGINVLVMNYKSKELKSAKEEQKEGMSSTSAGQENSLQLLADNNNNNNNNNNKHEKEDRDKKEKEEDEKEIKEAKGITERMEGAEGLSPHVSPTDSGFISVRGSGEKSSRVS